MAKFQFPPDFSFHARVGKTIIFSMAMSVKQITISIVGVFVGWQPTKTPTIEIDASAEGARSRHNG